MICALHSSPAYLLIALPLTHSTLAALASTAFSKHSFLPLEFCTSYSFHITCCPPILAMLYFFTSFRSLCSKVSSSKRLPKLHKIALLFHTQYPISSLCYFIAIITHHNIVLQTHTHTYIHTK